MMMMMATLLIIITTMAAPPTSAIIQSPQPLIQLYMELHDASTLSILTSIWDNLCIDIHTGGIEVQTCPAWPSQNKRYPNTITPVYLSQNTVVPVALDPSHIGVSTNATFSVPVCEPIVWVGFINITLDMVMKNEIVFHYCTDYALSPPCCQTEWIDKTVLSAAEFNCNNYTAYPQLKRFDICNNATSLPAVPFTDQCLIINANATVLGYDVCKGEVLAPGLNLFHGVEYPIFNDHIVQYPAAVQFLRTNMSPSTIIYYQGSIIIANIDLSAVNTSTCSKKPPAKMKCLSVDCRMCSDDMCTAGDHCLQGCVDNFFIPPNCTQLKQDGYSTMLAGEQMCQCTTTGFTGVIDYCTGQPVNITFHKQCYQTVPTPPAYRTDDPTMSWAVMAAHSKALIVVPDGAISGRDGKLYYVDKTSPNGLCSQMGWALSRAFLHNYTCTGCDAGLCEYGICTDYGGCIGGCKDKTFKEPWCTTRRNDYNASLLATDLEITHVLPSAARSTVIIVVSSCAGAALSSIVGIIVGFRSFGGK